MSEKNSGWSWGGAMFTVVVLALSGRLVAAILVTLSMFIPIVNFLVMLGAFIWGGLRGRDWLSSDESLLPQQVATYQTFLDRVGRYFFWVVVVALGLWLVILMVGVGGSMMRWDHNGAETMQMFQALENLEGLQDLEDLAELEAVFGELEGAIE